MSDKKLEFFGYYPLPPSGLFGEKVLPSMVVRTPSGRLLNDFWAYHKKHKNYRRKNLEKCENLRFVGVQSGDFSHFF